MNQYPKCSTVRRRLMYVIAASLTANACTPTRGTQARSEGSQELSVVDGAVTSSSRVAIRNEILNSSLKAAKNLYSTLPASKSFDVSVPVSAVLGMTTPQGAASDSQITLRIPQREDGATEWVTFARMQKLNADRLRVTDSTDVSIGNVIAGDAIETSGVVVVQVAEAPQRIAVSATDVHQTEKEAESARNFWNSKGVPSFILKAQMLDPDGVRHDVFVPMPMRTLKEKGQ